MTYFHILVALNVLDSYLTLRVLLEGGHEANPFMRALMDRIGAPPALVVVKAATLGLLYVIDVGDELLIALCVVYAGICAWNWRVLRRLRAR